ncbi:archease [Kamptonema cortianum]|nr:archease [Geitlerinema splendidum]MDK3161404.1 archease [Kamptonema cortianum]
MKNKKVKKSGEGWELFSHKADMGIRGIAPTFEKAFEQAGFALTGVMIDPTQVHEVKHIKVTCRAPNRDALFYDWINELVFQMSTLNMIFSHYKVTIFNEKNEFSFAGEAWGEKIDPKSHEIAVEVKGATFAELKTEETQDGRCLVQCVVDV